MLSLPGGNVCFKSHSTQVTPTLAILANEYISPTTLSVLSTLASIVLKVILFILTIQKYFSNGISFNGHVLSRHINKSKRRSCSLKTALILVQLSLANKESGLSQPETAAGSTQRQASVFIQLSTEMRKQRD